MGVASGYRSTRGENAGNDSLAHFCYPDWLAETHTDRSRGHTAN